MMADIENGSHTGTMFFGLDVVNFHYLFVCVSTEVHTRLMGKNTDTIKVKFATALKISETTRAKYKIKDRNPRI